MEITNDNFFNIKYNTKLDRLELQKKRKFIQMVQKHKIISIILIALIMFICLDFILISSFIKVLESI